jgi:hypothetical protein
VGEIKCTALIRYQDRWAVEDPVLDLAIFWHDQRMYAEMYEKEEFEDEVIGAGFRDNRT